MKGFLDSEEEDVNALEKKYTKKRKFQVFSGGKKERDYVLPEKPPSTPCQCQMAEDENSIFCNRHQCLKSKSLHGLCKNRMDYFEMWEDGEGPMQDPVNRMMAARGQQKTELKEEEEVINANPHETMGFFKTGDDPKYCTQDSEHWGCGDNG